VLFSPIHASNIVRRDPQHPVPDDGVRELEVSAKANLATKAGMSKGTTNEDHVLKSKEVPPPLRADVKASVAPEEKGEVGTLMIWQTCAAAISIVTSVVCVCYWSKGPLVIMKVLIYVLALATMKGAVKLVEGNNSFKFPLFLTAFHFVFGATAAFALLFRGSMSTGVAMMKPSFHEFATRFGPISFAFAMTIAMSNISLVYSTSSFVEIVGSSGPIFCVLLMLAMKKPFDLKLLGPCFLVVLGCVLTSNGEAHFSALGLILAFGANFPRALRGVLQQLLLQQGENGPVFSPIEVLAWTCLPSSMIMLLWSLVQEGSAPYSRLYEAGVLSQLFVTLVLSAVNATILNTAILFVVKDLGAVGTQLIAQTKSILVVLGGMCFLKEQVSYSEFGGFFCVMLGVYAYNDLDSRLKAAKSEAEKAEKLAPEDKVKLVKDVK